MYKQQVMVHYFKPVVNRATTSTATNITGGSFDPSTVKGYHDKEIGRTFRRDVEKVQAEIIQIAGDDPLRQLQLADGAFKRFSNMQATLIVEEQQAGRIVLGSLQED